MPFSAGGTTDMFARMLAQGLQQKYGTPFVVDNRPGAGGNVGAAAVARAARDGHTLLVGTVSTHAINPFIYKTIAFDAEKDFQPVSLIARLPNMLVVGAKLPVTTIGGARRASQKERGQAELRLLGRRYLDPSGVGAVPAANRHQDGARALPQLGEVMNALIGGHIDLAFDNITLAWPQSKAGKIRAVAVTSTQVSPTAPEIPPVAATLPGFDATSWHGVFAPARTPRAIVDALAAEVKRIFEQPELQKTLLEVGAVAAPMTPEAVRDVHRVRAAQVAGGRAGGRRRGPVSGVGSETISKGTAAICRAWR